MALARKTFFSLGGPTYIPDARVDEAQRQQQIDNANAASLRASQIQQAQLQQQRAESGWKNKLAMEQLALQKLASQFNYGSDAQALRAREAELPWARMDQQQGQFDASLGLDRDRLGLQQERFDYDRSMNRSPEEASLDRALARQLQQNAVTRSDAMTSPERLAAEQQAAINRLLSDTLANDPARTREMIGLEDASKRRAGEREEIDQRYYAGDQKLDRAMRLLDYGQAKNQAEASDYALSGMHAAFAGQEEAKFNMEAAAQEQARQEAMLSRALSQALGNPALEALGPEGIKTLMEAVKGQADIRRTEANSNYREAELGAAMREAALNEETMLAQQAQASAEFMASDPVTALMNDFSGASPAAINNLLMSAPPVARRQLAAQIKRQIELMGNGGLYGKDMLRSVVDRYAR